MKVALIKSGVVVNIIVVADLAQFQSDARTYCNSFDSMVDVRTSLVEIGWTYDGTFHAPGSRDRTPIDKAVAKVDTTVATLKASNSDQALVNAISDVSEAVKLLT